MSGEAGTEGTSGLGIDVALEGAMAATVRIAGEVDVATAPTLASRLEELVAMGYQHITVDLSGVAFIDSTGLGVLVTAHKQATGAGGSLTVTGVSRSTRKVFEISGVSRIVEVVE